MSGQRKLPISKEKDNKILLELLQEDTKNISSKKDLDFDQACKLLFTGMLLIDIGVLTQLIGKDHISRSLSVSLYLFAFSIPVLALIVFYIELSQRYNRHLSSYNKWRFLCMIPGGGSIAAVAFLFEHFSSFMFILFLATVAICFIIFFYWMIDDKLF